MNDFQQKGTLAGFLQELLSGLEAFTEASRTLERKVEDQLTNPDRVGLILRKILREFSDHIIFILVRRMWHPRFHKHLDLEAPKEAVLCAFGEVQDTVVKQDGLPSFLNWIEGHSTFDAQAFQAALTNPSNIVKDVKDLSQTAAAIAYSMQHPPALKATVSSSQLRSDLRQGVDALASQGFIRRCLGGAPAIISDVLSQLGLQRVHLFSMYHSDAVASLYRGHPQRLDLNEDPPQLIPANHPGSYSAGGATYPHPTRNSDIFIYKQGHSVHIRKQRFTAQQDDRVVFRVYRYVGEHRNQWQQVKMKFLQQGHPTIWLQGPTVDPDEWPAPRGFVRWRVNNGVLEIEYVDETAIRQLRTNYDYIILSAPGLETFQHTDPLEYLEAQSLRQQLAWISQGPAKVHLEISGGADPSRDRIQPFIQNIKGLIHSMGINDGELLAITALRDYHSPVTVTQGTSQIYERYERAVRLAQELSLERLYVHGNDVDLILRRGGSPGDMRTEIQGDLFAKGIVVLAVLQRTVGDWRGYLNADHAIAIAQGMLEKAREKLKNAACSSAQEQQELGRKLGEAEEWLQNAKQIFAGENFNEAREAAEKAQEVVEQTFGIPREPGQAALSLSPVLLAKSFETLIEFAYDYVYFALGKGDPASPSGLTQEGKEIFQQIAETGYYVTRDPNGYSVAVVPVMWPELPIELNPTGAGDICSGISLVYSGF